MLHAFQDLRFPGMPFGAANVPPSMNQTGFLETGKPIKLTLDVNLTGVINSKSDLTQLSPLTSQVPFHLGCPFICSLPQVEPVVKMECMLV